ncbi:MAG: hypothetical protein AB1Z98_11380 [Nannocystaceae bacterium]
MLYMDVITAFLDEAVLLKISEDRMRQQTYEPVSAFARRHRAEGRASSLLLVLESRGLELPAEARERIMGCHDPAVLEQWLRRSLACTSLEALFEDE